MVGSALEKIIPFHSLQVLRAFHIQEKVFNINFRTLFTQKCKNPRARAQSSCKNKNLKKFRIEWDLYPWPCNYLESRKLNYQCKACFRNGALMSTQKSRKKTLLKLPF